jgi:hypothetical protein
MPVIYWGEAVMTAVHLLNGSPTKALHGMTPMLGTSASRW